MKATDILRREHEVILKGLSVFGTLIQRFEDDEPLDPVRVSQLIEFFRQFADGCHHAKEEGLLFPILERTGIARAPLRVMLAEHDEARAMLDALAEAVPLLMQPSTRYQLVSIANRYISLMKLHIAKENQVLFRIVDQRLDPQSARTLLDQFVALKQRQSNILRSNAEFVRKLDEEYSCGMTTP